jgi:radical SAM superfamily enzyme
MAFLKTLYERIARTLIDECPVCETSEYLIYQGGCTYCENCGWAACASG